MYLILSPHFNHKLSTINY